MRKGKSRTDLSYLRTAKALQSLAPSLRKYTSKKYRIAARSGRLDRWAKAAITRKETALRHTENLHPLTTQQWKRAKRLGIAAGKGLKAIRLRNQGNNPKIHIAKHGISIGSNGRRNHYVPVSPPGLDALMEAAEEAYAKEDETHIVTVWLWTVAGKADESYADLDAMQDHLADAFQRYKHQQDWIRGIVWLREKSSR